jgi:adenylate cyclase
MDVAGYARLTDEDEAGTHAALRGHLAELITPKIAAHAGRVVNYMGDGVLAEFASAVRAVECAVDLQRGMAERNASIAEGRRLRFRIGINVGDIIVEGKDIFGDGVIIAARLEGLSEPGGLCISRTVRDQVRGRLPIEFIDLGEQVVRHIPRPVRAFGLGSANIAALPEAAAAPPAPARRRVAAWPGMAFAAPLVVAALGAAAWYFYPREVPLSGWPSVAVLPLVNLSGDKDQDYFTDGLTDDLLTDLARIPHLVVMSRSATAKYKGQAPDIHQVGRQLGVRYMVEGSVRRAGDQIRITAQLIEVATDAHVWAEHYDRPTKEIFAVQDEMTRAIAQSLILNISHEDLERAKRKPPSSLSAYELFLRGREQNLLNTPEGTSRAIDLYQQAVAADPTYADAIGDLANTYSRGFALHWGRLRGQAAMDRAYDLAQRAFALDPTSVFAARAISFVYLFTHRTDDAVAVMEKLLNSNPSDDAVLIRLGDIYTYAGQPERGIGLLRQVYQLNPRYAGAGHAFIGRGLLLLNRHEEAIAELKTCSLVLPAYRVCHEVAAVAYAEMGRLDEARAEAMEAHRLDPDFTLASAPEVLPFKNPQDLQRFLDGLRKAGLPER